MGTPHNLRLLLLFGAMGCTSNPHVMTPRIAPALTEAGLELPIVDFRAFTGWIPTYGHGLSVEVRAARSAESYRRDLELELEGAAEVCAALGGSEAVLEWNFLEVLFTNEYGRMPPRSREVAGVARVVMRRETLLLLRETEVPTSEYPLHWDFVEGFKDQPDSKEVLRW
jgi:hypothetical protein